MTHDELLSKVEQQTIHIANKIRPVSDTCEKEIGGFANALRAVVEMHYPNKIKWAAKKNFIACYSCAEEYPCPTIETIAEELK